MDEKHIQKPDKMWWCIAGTRTTLLSEKKESESKQMLIPVQHVVVELPCFVHHAQPGKDGLSTYEDDHYLHPFGNKNYIYHNLDMFHNANLDQSQYQDGICCMWSQMLEQLDYEDGKAPSWRNVWHDVEYHTDNDFPGKDLRRPVGCQKIHSQESHLCPLCHLAHRWSQTRSSREKNKTIS